MRGLEAPREVHHRVRVLDDALEDVAARRLGQVGGVPLDEIGEVGSLLGRTPGDPDQVVVAPGQTLDERRADVAACPRDDDPHVALLALGPVAASYPRRAG